MRLGFTLFEFIIYLVLLSIFSFIILKFFAGEYLRLASLSKKNNELLNLISTISLLTRDIQQTNKVEIVSAGKIKLDSCYWFFSKNKLYRRQQNNIHKNLIMENVDYLKFKKKGNYIICKLKVYKYLEIKRIVLLRNRVIK